jgi:monoterpene epsilon-lactone hydrolase
MDRAVGTTAQQAARDAFTSLATRLAAEQAAGIVAMRAVHDAWAAELFTLPDGAHVGRTELGGVACETVRAAGVSSDRRILHFHGGGFVIGSPSGYHPFGAVLSDSCAATVILPDYGLSPEHSPQAQVQDAVAVYRALLDGGADSANIVVSGDSAGGGLALGLLIALRDAGDPLPPCGVAMSPWADGTLSGDSVKDNGETDAIVGAEFLSGLADLRFGEDGDRRDPLASPVFADYTGIPPLLLFASRAETLRDDAVRVAEKARGDGVKVELELYADMVHVWLVFAGQLEEADRAVAQVGAFVAAHAGGGSA